MDMRADDMDMRAEDVDTGAEEVEDVGETLVGSMMSLSCKSPRHSSVYERVVVCYFVCILVLLWVVVKSCVSFVGMGLRHGLRGRHI
jgi:hypothetical protein